MPRFDLGDRVTVMSLSADDPIEIWLHRHAVVAEVLRGTAGPGYIVGHPGGVGRRFGPFVEEALAAGWVPVRT